MLNISRSGYYEWRDRLPSARETADDELATVIARIHSESRGTHGAPRVHAELRLTRDRHVGTKRVARLMGLAGITGIRRLPTEGRQAASVAGAA